MHFGQTGSVDETTQYSCPEVFYCARYIQNVVQQGIPCVCHLLVLTDGPTCAYRIIS